MCCVMRDRAVLARGGEGHLLGRGCLRRGGAAAALGQQRMQTVDLDEFLGQPKRAVVLVDWVADDAADLGVADVDLGKVLRSLPLRQ